MPQAVKFELLLHADDTCLRQVFDTCFRQVLDKYLNTATLMILKSNLTRTFARYVIGLWTIN